MNMAVDTDEILEDLLSELQSSTIDCSWEISTDKLISILDLPKEVFYHKLYLVRRNHYAPNSIRIFTENDIEFLCTLLEEILRVKGLEDKFLKAGIYFQSKKIEEIRDIFIELMQSTLDRHKLDKELLMLLVSSTKTFDDAFYSYLDDKLNIEHLINKSVDIFTNWKSIDVSYGADSYLHKYLAELIKLNKISIQKITREYRAQFYFDLFGKVKREGKMDPEIKKLLDFFNLEEGATVKDLKKRFKELLLIYHPDLNKDDRENIEKTQAIIENYNKLFELLR